MEVLSVIGFVIRALGFAVLGFAVGRFTMDAYKKAVFFGMDSPVLQNNLADALAHTGNYSEAGSCL